jgi:hypothetical protein
VWTHASSFTAPPLSSCQNADLTAAAALAFAGAVVATPVTVPPCGFGDGVLREMPMMEYDFMADDAMAMPTDAGAPFEGDTSPQTTSVTRVRRCVRCCPVVARSELSWHMSLVVRTHANISLE